MNFNNFFIKYNNKFADFDGIYPNECVDLTKLYFTEVLNLPPFKGNAINYWTDIHGLTRIPKTLFNRPQPGDIVVWGTKPYGHVGICNWISFLELNCFEQNNPEGSPCHFQTHNYKGILGWLRPTLPKEPRITFIYASDTLEIAPGDEFCQKVAYYTSNVVQPQFRALKGQFMSPKEGMITTEQACQIIDTHNVRDKFVFICYNSNSTSAYLATSWYPKRGIAFCTTPLPTDSDRLTHEFLHMLRRVLGRMDTETEYLPPDWNFQFQFDQLKNDYKKL